MADLKALQIEIHENAKVHGFWEDGEQANIPSKLMLIVSELAEALEEYRLERMNLYYESGSKSDKPKGFDVELADALIRILDLAAYQGLDMDALVELKMEYNRGRSYKHDVRV